MSKSEISILHSVSSRFQTPARKNVSVDSNALADKSVTSTFSVDKLSEKSRDTAATQKFKSSKSSDGGRKAKMKRFIHHNSTTSNDSENYKQLVDFSNYQLAAATSKEEPQVNMYNRTSMSSAGIIEFTETLDDHEKKRDRSDQYERRKKEKKSTEYIVQPIQINLKPYQIEDLKDAFSMLENEMELLDIIHVPTIIRACGFEPNVEEVREILEEIKPVNEGFLTLSELIRVFEAKLKRKDPIEEIRRAFKVFDFDNTGMITLDNLKRISKCVGEELHEGEMKEMISAADITHSGGVTMENFVKLITRKEYYDY